MRARERGSAAHGRAPASVSNESWGAVFVRAGMDAEVRACMCVCVRLCVCLWMMHLRINDTGAYRRIARALLLLQCIGESDSNEQINALLKMKEGPHDL